MERIQLNYQEAQRKARLPHTGTHILRHGMAKLVRRIGGGLDAVIAMTGHKDFKLANHYSKLDKEDQKDIALKISSHLNKNLYGNTSFSVENPKNERNESGNVISLAQFARRK